MKLKSLSLLAALCAVLAFGSLGFAQETTDQQTPGKSGKHGFGRHGKMGGKHGGGHLLRFASELNLSEDQKSRINQIIETNRIATQPQRDELRAIWTQRRESGSLTEQQQNRVREISSQLRENGKRTHEEILSVLTPEQRQLLDQKREEMRQRREEFRQKRLERRSNQSGETPPATQI